jgi:hypothetical protein
MLLGGPHMREFKALMAPFGMRLPPLLRRDRPDVLMCRSVMAKGLETFKTGCVTAAARSRCTG